MIFETSPLILAAVVMGNFNNETPQILSRMTIDRKKIFVSNLIISILLSTLLIFFLKELVSSIGYFLLAINRPVSVLSLNFFDGIILGFIPLWSYLLYKKNGNVTLKEILLLNLWTLFSVLIICIVAFINVATFIKSDSPFIPTYMVFIPFPKLFWTLIFIIGVTLPHLIKKIRRNRMKNIDAINTQER